MNVQKKVESQPEKCLTCKQYWGSASYDGLCSTCYGKIKKEIKIEKKPQVIEVEKQSEKPVQQKGTTKGAQQDKGRCFECKKKLGLLEMECKCGYRYCNRHRLPESHECDFNYQQSGKAKLKKQIVKVAHQKLPEV